MTYPETLDFLYAQLPMFTRIGAAAYKEDLHNTIALCDALGNPQQKFKTIHVAGTNGKGSTSHMLAAILQESGYKTGLYTSPHIKDFGERIRINGQMIDPDFVIDFVESIRELLVTVQPSFFELTVAMAFEYFAKEKVDIAVIETGLGGRLDSTNIIKPVLSVITNIGYDHMNLLGNTLPEIASQKAGIIKKDTPVVIGELLPETMPVFVKEANKKEAPVYFAQSRFITEYLEPTGNLLFCNVKDLDDGSFEKLRLDLNGIYQAKNICTVLMTVEILRKKGYHLPEEKMHTALENVKGLTGLSGRWDILQNRPTIIQDVAHNTDGISLVLQQLKHNYPQSNIHFVLGFVKDKDVEHVLELFPKDAQYYFTNAHIPRALPFSELQQTAASKGLQGNGFDNVNDAIAMAKKNAADNDVIMICGSFFIIGEIEMG
ncbi:MAG: bifunctional folylpolyglutamate synthase/dihydrofolate synthase [Rhizobacter sp.]|nr:bifunctional folylpolyglutamate synthase/dihydrofolate synthase [Ferruginibacter sp.]